jgi:hypothetical protein
MVTDVPVKSQVTVGKIFAGPARTFTDCVVNAACAHACAGNRRAAARSHGTRKFHRCEIGFSIVLPLLALTVCSIRREHDGRLRDMVQIRFDAHPIRIRRVQHHTHGNTGMRRKMLERVPACDMLDSSTSASGVSRGLPGAYRVKTQGGQLPRVCREGVVTVINSGMTTEYPC